MRQTKLSYARKLFALVLIFGAFVLLFQNCQKSGSSFSGLQSTCFVDCNQEEAIAKPDANLIKVSIVDGGDGHLDLSTVDDVFTVYGSCSRGGFKSTTITAKLFRTDGSSPNPLKTQSTGCMSGSWQVSFSGMQNYSPSTNSKSLTLEVSILAIDDFGQIIYPAIPANGFKSDAVDYAGSNPYPTTTTTTLSNPQNAPQTLSILAISKSAANPKNLNIYALLFPNSNYGQLTLNFKNLDTGFSKSFTDNVSPDINIQVVSLFIQPGHEDTSTTDASTQKYMMNSMQIPNTNIKDYNVLYDPLDAGETEPIKTTSSAYCYFTDDNGGRYKARSVRIPLYLVPINGIKTFTLHYQYRNLGTGGDWNPVDQQVTVNSSYVGEIILRSSADDASSKELDPQKQLLLFRVYYNTASGKQRWVYVVTDGTRLTQNAACWNAGTPAQ